MPNEILIVDDHILARLFARTLLEHCGFGVCGEAAGALEAIQKVREMSPAIVLLDITMPGMNGIQAAREIRRIAPSAKIVFFTIYEGKRVADAMSPYCDAFVPKSAAGTDLIPTLARIIETNA